MSGNRRSVHPLIAHPLLPSPGTNRDWPECMTRFCTIGLATWLWATTACAQTESRAANRAVDTDLTRAAGERLAGDPLAARADSLVRAGRPWRATILLAP